MGSYNYIYAHYLEISPLHTLEKAKAKHPILGSIIKQVVISYSRERWAPWRWGQEIRTKSSL